MQLIVTCRPDISSPNCTIKPISCKASQRLAIWSPLRPLFKTHRTQVPGISHRISSLILTIKMSVKKAIPNCLHKVWVVKRKLWLAKYLTHNLKLVKLVVVRVKEAIKINFKSRHRTLKIITRIFLAQLLSWIPTAMRPRVFPKSTPSSQEEVAPTKSERTRTWRKEAARVGPKWWSQKITMVSVYFF